MNRRHWLKASLLAAGGFLAGPASRRACSQPAPRVVIVGGGFAGSACALALRRLNAGIEVLLVDPAESYTTCPMSNEVIVGLRGLNSLEVTRGGLRHAGVLVVRDRVERIDAERRRVQLAGGSNLPYDRLVMAPGIRFLWERIEGLSPTTSPQMPHAWMAGEQTAALAAQLRAMPAGGVVAISVPNGLMRCPPAPYERASLVAHFLKTHKRRAKLLILDANNSFPRQPQFEDAWRQFYPRLIDWIPLTQDGAVERVDVNSRTLFTAAAAHRVSVANVIPPQAPAQLAPDSGLAEQHGWCPVDPVSFESRRVPGVHVIGDACIADAMPKSGSAAVSQARHCAAAIDALLAGHAMPAVPFDSVCYAHVSPGLALEFPGHFTVADDRIVSPGPRTALPARLDRDAAARDAAASVRWYEAIRGEAFAG